MDFGEKFVEWLAQLVATLGVTLLFSWPVSMLWNACLVGVVSGVSPIDWTRAWGIMLLVSLLKT